MYKTKTIYTHEILRNDILTGKYTPNERLILKDLADYLNLSIIPIREALSLLERDGLVRQIPHQGYTVAPFSVEEMEELFTLRISLESLALEITIKKSNENLISKLYSLTKEMDKYIELNKKFKEKLSSQNPRRKKFMSINRDFHLTIATFTGFVHLPSILNNIFDMSERYMNLLEFVVGLNRIDYLEHLEILKSIKRKDEKSAKVKMEKHIRRVLNELKKYVITRGWLLNRSSSL